MAKILGIDYNVRGSDVDATRDDAKNDSFVVHLESKTQVL